MKIDWSDQTLTHLYENYRHNGYDSPHRIGAKWPYSGGSFRDIQDYVRLAAIDLGQSDLIAVTVDEDYSSFLSVFCSKKDGQSTYRQGDVMETAGIFVYLSLAAPVAVYGSAVVTQSKNGSSHLFLDPSDLGTIPAGDWDSERAEIVNKLKSLDFEIGDSGTMNAPLPFEADLETNLGEPPYRVFDLLFFWED